MGWYKHSTDSRNDPRLHALAQRLRRPPWEVYAGWHMLLEIINSEGDCGKLDLGNGHVGISTLARALGKRRESMERWLDGAFAVGLLTTDAVPEPNRDTTGARPALDWRSTGVILPTNWDKYAGDYARRKLRNVQEKEYVEEIGVRTQNLPGTDRLRNGHSEPPVVSRVDISNRTDPPSKPTGKGVRGEGAEQAFTDARRRFRRHVGKSIGSLPGRRVQWEALVREHGAETVVAAVELWARERGRGLKELRYPLAVFVAHPEEWIEAVKDLAEPEEKTKDLLPAVEFEGQKMPVVVRDQILRERSEESARLSREKEQEEEDRKEAERLQEEGF